MKTWIILRYYHIDRPHYHDTPEDVVPLLQEYHEFWTHYRSNIVNFGPIPAVIPLISLLCHSLVPISPDYDYYILIYYYYVSYVIIILIIIITFLIPVTVILAQFGSKAIGMICEPLLTYSERCMMTAVTVCP